LETNRWTFLTNHSHVLLSLYRNPYQTLREVSIEVGITERSVQRIVSELEEAGYLERERDGRRNRYLIHLDGPLRHPIEGHRRLRDLVDLVFSTDDGKTTSDQRGRSPY
jgi:DNA-binding transcriptional ArsR family regulator